MTKSDFFTAYLPTILTPQECASAYAPSNIALAKYWGKRNIELNLPTNGSLSISLGTLGTHTAITQSTHDTLILNNNLVPDTDPVTHKVFAFVELFRRGQNIPLHITTHNTIPTAAGLASSASGFAALTLALADIFQLKLPLSILSAMARIGSGSAARSLWHGFVEWQRGNQTDGADSIAHPLETTWQALRIGLLELDLTAKKITSRDGMTHTKQTSPLFDAWTQQAEQDLITIRHAIANEDFTTLGETAEANALAMHATMLAARPFLTYLLPDTLATIIQIQHYRAEGLPIYCTIDAGPNVKLLYQAKDEREICTLFPNVRCINPWIQDNAAK